MNWNELKENIYYCDGSLRDIYVEGTTIDDWRKWVDTVNAYELVFYDNTKQTTATQIHFEAITDSWKNSNVLNNVTIKLGAIEIMCNFFSEDEIENHFDPDQINSVEDHKKLLDYMKTVSRALQKPVKLTPESAPDYILIEEAGF